MIIKGHKSEEGHSVIIAGPGLDGPGGKTWHPPKGQARG